MAASSSPRTGGEEELGLVVLLDPRQVVDVLGTILWRRSFPCFDSGGDQGMSATRKERVGRAVKPCRYPSFSHLCSSHFCVRVICGVFPRLRCVQRGLLYKVP
jgi:hypothetical protein